MSNIFSLGLAPKGFSLPDGFSWDVRICHGLKEGQAKVWDNYGSLFAELHVKSINRPAAFSFSRLPSGKPTKS